MTRFAPFLFALTLACDPATAVLLDGDALDDTADADSSDPRDPDSDIVDPDTDVDTEPDTEPPPLQWNGERTFTFEQFGDDCTDTLIESGPEVTNQPDFAFALDQCPECERIFYVNMDKDTLCATQFFEGYPVATPVMRGIATGADGNVRVFYGMFANEVDWNEFGDVSGSQDDFEYDYQGVARVRGFNVDYQVEASGSVD